MGDWRQPDAGQRLQSRFDEVIATLGHDPAQRAGAAATRARLRVRAREIAEVLRESDGPPLCEQLLIDPESRLFGVLDLLLPGRSGTVLDFKTGREGAFVTPSIRHQMLVYAHLFAVKYGHLPARVAVFSLSRGLIDTPVDEGEVAAQLSALAAAERGHRGEARPSPDCCRFCWKRMTCEPHWALVSTWPDADATQGYVTKLEDSTSGAWATQVGDEWLTGVPKEQLRDIAPGAYVRAVRIKRATASPPAWTATRVSQVESVAHP